MNWNLMIQVLITVILKLIASSLFLLYFPQIFYTVLQENPPAISEEIKGCAIRWDFFEGKCYFFTTRGETWDDCWKTCTQFGSNLAVVNSKEELMFLKSTARFEQYFIGLTQRDGRWTWIDGTELDPNILDIKAGRFPCVAVGLDSIGPVPCSVGYRCICEKKA